MRVSKKAMLAAGLIAGAAALTGCTADMKPAATPTPKAAQQATAEPATAAPTQQASPEATMETDTAGEETPAPLALRVDGEEIDAHAIEEGEELLLPLVETAQALGYKAESEETETEEGNKRVLTLEKDESRITVSWTVSDNTIRGVSWQKDGLLVPVDARLTTLVGVVYAPAAFFEEAMDARVKAAGGDVEVTLPEPMDTPENDTEDAGKNG